MHWLFFVIRRLVVSICMLYTINIIVSSAHIIIPINVFSIISVALLGLPSVVGLIVIQKFI